MLRKVSLPSTSREYPLPLLDDELTWSKISRGGRDFVDGGPLQSTEYQQMMSDVVSTGSKPVKLKNLIDENKAPAAGVVKKRVGLVTGYLKPGPSQGAYSVSDESGSLAVTFSRNLKRSYEQRFKGGAAVVLRRSTLLVQARGRPILAVASSSLVGLYLPGPGRFSVDAVINFKPKRSDRAPGGLDGAAGGPTETLPDWRKDMEEHVAQLVSSLLHEHWPEDQNVQDWLVRAAMKKIEEGGKKPSDGHVDRVVRAVQYLLE